jgi:sulfhydrogenase subunit alpha
VIDTRTFGIRVPALARVEGEGALEIDIRGGRVESARLRIYEPPRLFEKLLEGRRHDEVPDIVARICGICPVAYQMSAVSALENAFGIAIDPVVRAWRRAMYCGEWIQSHALHIHLLAAPDFFGAASVVELAARHPESVRRGLGLQRLGNDLIRLLGGRSVHPVGVRVGGFHRAPPAREVEALLPRLRAGLADAQALIGWVAGFEAPDAGQDHVDVALRDPAEYPMYAGNIASSTGLLIPPSDYETHFEEHQVPHSTALHASVDGAPYLVGPLARLNLNADRIPPALHAMLREAGLALPCRNMFASVVARAAEIWLALHEALAILERGDTTDRPWVDAPPRAGTGAAATEAPRGLLWHRYDTDAHGCIVRARIVPPTSQNQARMEEDLRRSLEAYGLDRPESELRRHAEMVVRNYDPCISCATHFLDLRIRRA